MSSPSSDIAGGKKTRFLSLCYKLNTVEINAAADCVHVTQKLFIYMTPDKIYLWYQAETYSVFSSKITVFVRSLAADMTTKGSIYLAKPSPITAICPTL